jgi:hypothetical protein
MRNKGEKNDNLSSVTGRLGKSRVGEEVVDVRLFSNVGHVDDVTEGEILELVRFRYERAPMLFA